MKKKIIVVAICVLVLGLGIYTYKEIIVKSFRYSTAIEAYEKSCPSGAELLDIVESHDIAMIIYRRKDGVLSDHIIAKDDRGWSTLYVTLNNAKNRMTDNGFFYIKEIQGKSVVHFLTSTEQNSPIPSVSDSLNSIFTLKSFDANGGGKVVYGFLVIEGALPDGYSILLDDTEINF